VADVESVETVVVGAGQAGLSVSHCLKRRGHEHLVLERGLVGETWRSERWDGFRLNTPNFWLRLPGHEYRGDDPEAFLTRDETVAFLERYAESSGSPIRTGVDVRSLRCDDGGYLLETSAGAYRAGSVVVASGSFRRPAERTTGAGSALFQLHASEYRNPGELPDGGVLVVGSGQSGCQIAAELNRAGRSVYLSVGRCPSLPFWYRGRTIYEWYVDSGVMDDGVETLPSATARLACNPTIASSHVAHLVGPRRLAREGVTLVGRVLAVEDGRAVFAGDASQRLAEGDDFVATLNARLDEHAARAGLALPPDDAEPELPREVPELRELDLHTAGVGTILWANGWRPDYGWIELPILDEHGWPRQSQGVAEEPGLYFVGLHWLRKRKSALLLGVGEDAEHVAATVAGGSAA
jgi:putative flavoprotein involved in K+ transport